MEIMVILLTFFLLVGYASQRIRNHDVYFSWLVKLFITIKLKERNQYVV